MKAIIKSIHFIAVVILFTVSLEFVHCAVSGEYRNDCLLDWQLRHPAGAVRMRLGGDIAKEALYRSFREDPIYTGRALIAAIMM